MASSLRRTLHLSVLYSAIVIAVVSCQNTGPSEEKFEHDFDSAQKKLDRAFKSVDQTAFLLYESVITKYSELFIEHFRQTIIESRNYIITLKKQFIVACGDSTGDSLPAAAENNIDISNRFFFTPYREALFYKISKVQGTLISQNDDPDLDDEIRRSTGITEAMTAEQFMKKYFYNIPPVAALTILNKFENDINSFEKKVLQNLLKTPNVTPQ